jgi:demethylmenaquinone methyltransferase/2-methoxy-6-polyprenyl-1,4-benzoquinol methylase
MPAEVCVTRSARAEELFAPLGETYDQVGAVLSFGQDPRWRRFLVSRVEARGCVLDVATGTGLVADELRRRGSTVTGLDLSGAMLQVARRRFGGRVALVQGTAEALPFPDASFDHLTFTYLLRYVDDPPATLRELARVVKPGGTIASLEFCVPRGLWRLFWEIYVAMVLPAAGRAVSPGWHAVGRFLGPSISDFWQRWPLDRQLRTWREAGVRGVQARNMSLGGGIVIWGTRA